MDKLRFFVDLKRFEVAGRYGGICTAPDPVTWAKELVKRSVELGMDRAEAFSVVYFFPESCLVPALEQLRAMEAGPGLQVGSQGIYRRDTAPGGDYGAMTGTRPASAMVSLGCLHSLVAHSDERRDKLQLMIDYDPQILRDEHAMERAQLAVDRACAEEAQHALDRGMRILYCVGETAEQKGSARPEEYLPRVRRVLEQQMTVGLGRLRGSAQLDQVCLAYEPVWAIGPGRPTPDADDVRFAAGYVKELSRCLLGRELSVVYGGGLKTANAAALAAVESLDGGFNGLSRFVPPIHFDPDEYLEIILAFLRGKGYPAGKEKRP